MSLLNHFNGLSLLAIMLVSYFAVAKNTQSDHALFKKSRNIFKK